MDQASGTVRHQLEAARAARDVVKTLCLNDKLSQIDVGDALGARPPGGTAGRRAAQRRRAGEPRVRDPDRARQRAEQLTAEANQCIGEEVAFVGQTQIAITQINPNLPIEDTTSYPART